MEPRTQSFASWEEAFRFCLQLHERGEIAQAEEGYGQLLASAPEHSEALRLRGLALCQLGRASEGLPLLQQARRLHPANPLAHQHLGYALQLLDRPDEALESYRTAARLAPGDAAPWVNMAAIHLARENWPDALLAAREAVQRAPSLPEAQHNLGFALLENGQPAAALAPLQEAIRLRPDFAEGYLHLGRAEAELGRLEVAAAAYMHCLRIDSSHTGAAVNLANVWQRRGLAEEAIDLYQQVLRLHPERWEARLSLASALAAADRLAEAHTALEGVTPPPGVAQRVLLQRVGFLLAEDRKEDARTLLATAKERDLGYWAARYGLRRDDDDSAEIVQRLQNLWQDPAQGSFEERVQTAFLLAEHHHRKREYEPAFFYYAAGHASLRQSEPFDRAAWWAEREREFARYAELRGRDLAPAAPVQPVFIVGMPRSGTSLLEQILDSHAAMRGGGELPHMTRLAMQLGNTAASDAELRGYLVATQERYAQLAAGATWLTDKMPHNFEHLGSISLAFPQAPILLCRRDARDNCLSIFQQRFVAAHPYAHDLESLGQHYRDHEQVLRRWREMIPNPVLVVDYEELVGDLEAGVRRVLDFLQAPWDENCLRFHENRRKVRTASREQVTQPLYQSSVGRWQHYADHLQALIDALEKD